MELEINRLSIIKNKCEIYEYILNLYDRAGGLIAKAKGSSLGSFAVGEFRLKNEFEYDLIMEISSHFKILKKGELVARFLNADGNSLIPNLETSETPLLFGLEEIVFDVEGVEI